MSLPHGKSILLVLNKNGPCNMQTIMEYTASKMGEALEDVKEGVNDAMEYLIDMGLVKCVVAKKKDKTNNPNNIEKPDTKEEAPKYQLTLKRKYDWSHKKRTEIEKDDENNNGNDSDSSSSSNDSNKPSCSKSTKFAKKQSFAEVVRAFERMSKMYMKNVSKSSFLESRASSDEEEQGILKTNSQFNSSKTIKQECDDEEKKSISGSEYSAGLRSLFNYNYAKDPKTSIAKPASQHNKQPMSKTVVPETNAPNFVREIQKNVDSETNVSNHEVQPTNEIVDAEKSAPKQAVQTPKKRLEASKRIKASTSECIDSECSTLKLVKHPEFHNNNKETNTTNHVRQPTQKSKVAESSAKKHVKKVVKKNMDPACTTVKRGRKTVPENVDGKSNPLKHGKKPKQKSIESLCSTLKRSIVSIESSDSIVYKCSKRVKYSDLESNAKTEIFNDLTQKTQKRAEPENSSPKRGKQRKPKRVAKDSGAPKCAIKPTKKIAAKKWKMEQENVNPDTTELNPVILPKAENNDTLKYVKKSTSETIDSKCSTLNIVSYPEFPTSYAEITTSTRLKQPNEKSIAPESSTPKNIKQIIPKSIEPGRNAPQLTKGSVDPDSSCLKHTKEIVDADCNGMKRFKKTVRGNADPECSAMKRKKQVGKCANAEKSTPKSMKRTVKPKRSARKRVKKILEGSVDAECSARKRVKKTVEANDDEECNAIKHVLKLIQESADLKCSTTKSIKKPAQESAKPNIKTTKRARKSMPKTVDPDISALKQTKISDNPDNSALKTTKEGREPDCSAVKRVKKTVRRNVNRERSAMKRVKKTVRRNVNRERRAIKRVKKTVQRNVNAKSKAMKRAKNRLQNNVAPESKAAKCVTQTMPAAIDPKSNTLKTTLKIVDADNSALKTMKESFDPDCGAVKRIKKRVPGNIDTEFNAKKRVKQQIQEIVDLVDQTLPNSKYVKETMPKSIEQDSALKTKKKNEHLDYSSVKHIKNKKQDNVDAELSSVKHVRKPVQKNIDAVSSAPKSVRRRVKENVAPDKNELITIFKATKKKYRTKSVISIINIESSTTIIKKYMPKSILKKPTERSYTRKVKTSKVKNKTRRNVKRGARTYIQKRTKRKVLPKKEMEPKTLSHKIDNNVIDDSTDINLLYASMAANGQLSKYTQTERFADPYDSDGDYIMSGSYQRLTYSGNFRRKYKKMKTFDREVKTVDREVQTVADEIYGEKKINVVNSIKISTRRVTVVQQIPADMGTDSDYNSSQTTYDNKSIHNNKKNNASAYTGDIKTETTGIVPTNNNERKYKIKTVKDDAVRRKRTAKVKFQDSYEKSVKKYKNAARSGRTYHRGMSKTHKNSKRHDKTYQERRKRSMPLSSEYDK